MNLMTDRSYSPSIYYINSVCDALMVESLKNITELFTKGITGYCTLPDTIPDPFFTVCFCHPIPSYVFPPDITLVFVFLYITQKDIDFYKWNFLTGKF